MPSSPLTIAIDGPSGSGKSSVSKAVARELGLGYLDTGAMYRAVAWHCLDQEVDLTDQEAVAQAARDLPLEISTDPDDQTLRVGGTDITSAIRETRVTSQVSTVATNLDVRAELRRRQREIISEARDERGGIVAEGRDITTVVAPDAEHRILVTASEEARLARRSTELHGGADADQVEATRDQIVRRDRQDSTVSAFMEAADGVVTLDTSELDFDQVVAAVLALVRGEVEPAQHEEEPATSPDGHAGGPA
ncbi:Cytidylate kinase [Serinicoccus hydrothermalis]|uniref:Cytidylate kinase n=1 Tax=Serinicoccus hydrothermalis TaxID=1758689 RepID=A0A1B1N8S4_9MICO|nr:(d)CMP kinase [Serinicoccus hydrothermalis]ANS77814.1 Cytidylate kinase [Serinicoccus hydrothermalis]